jgi:Na+/H+-dicarboxylate symporter
LVNLICPGIINGVPAKELLELSEMTAETVASVSNKGGGDLIAVFLRMVPPNIINAAAQGQMLGLITFSLLFGYFMAQLKSEYA